MMGVPSYLPMRDLDVSMAQDDRSYRTRLDEFFIKVCATARSSTPQMGRPQAFVAEAFQDEVPAFALRILQDCFEVQSLATFQNNNYGNHSFGDPSRVMSSIVSFVSYQDIMKGCLFSLSFFQYLAPGSTLVCAQYGASAQQAIPPGLEVVAQHFSSPHHHATAKFLRVDRQWQSQVRT